MFYSKVCKGILLKGAPEYKGFRNISDIESSLQALLKL